jgi:hypothetical protein
VTVSSSFAIGLELGRCDEMRAELFLRLVDPTIDSTAGGEAASEASPKAVGYRLVGTITGPRRGRDTTLPTTARLLSLPTEGMGCRPGNPIARAILTEPAYWTPDLPNLYRVECRLEAASDQTPPAGSPAKPHDGSLCIDATVGLRRLGTRGRSFWLDGRRWVPRAVVAASLPDLPALKAVSLGAAVSGQSETLLAAADEKGIAMLPLLASTDLTSDRIGMLARHPAVMLAIVSTEAVSDMAPVVADRIAVLRRIKGTLLLGLTADGSQPPPPTVAGVDFLAVRLPAGGLPHASWRVGSPCPLVAWRCDPAAVASGRAGCDALQRDLAMWGMAAGGDRLAWDWAGYLVG